MLKSKKMNLLSFFTGVLCTILVIGLSGSSFAELVKTNALLTFNGIKVVLDGKPVAFSEDSSGNKSEPFILNGRTYLPLAAIGEALGKKVEWDGKTQTVYLGDKPGGISYLTETIAPYSINNVNVYYLNSSEKLNIAGTAFETGLIKADYNDSELKYNLDSQYKSFEFYYGPSKFFEPNSTGFDVYLDNVLYKHYTVTQNDLAKKETIDLTGVLQLRIVFPYSASETRSAIGNPIIK